MGARQGREWAARWLNIGRPGSPRHCLVSSSTRAPVSGADAYLGSRSEPIQRLSVARKAEMEMYGSRVGYSPRGARDRKAQSGTDWTAEPPHSPSILLFLCSDSDKRDAQPSRTTNRHCLISPMWARAGIKEVPSH